MILEHVHLHPFAGISDKRVEFSPRLTVVLGPNEAGKSTLYRAIRAVLLEPVTLTKNQFEKHMGAYLPASGGDILRVGARGRVSAGGKTSTSIFEIAKSWKRANNAGSATLTRDATGEIADARTAHETAQELLPCSSATLESVLLSGQADLHETVAKGVGRESSEEIASLVRSAVMETGGVSLERFFDVLDERIKDLYDHWDRKAAYPQDGRGIERPWKREIGQILEAFYDKETLRRELERTEAWEARLEEVDAQLASQRAEWRRLDAEYREYSALRGDVQKRATLEAELDSIVARLERLTGVLKQWPVDDKRLEDLPKERERTAAHLAELEGKLERANRAREREGLVRRAQRVRELAERLDKARSAVAESEVVSDSELARLRELTSEKQQLNATIAASKLTVSLSAGGAGEREGTSAQPGASPAPGAGADKTAEPEPPHHTTGASPAPGAGETPAARATPAPRASAQPGATPADEGYHPPADITLVRADNSSETVHLEAGQTRELTADGRVDLEHEGVLIRVSAGEGELDEAVERRNACAAELSQLLDSLGIEGLEEAEAMAKKHSADRGQLKHAEDALKSELGGDDYEEVVAILEEPEIEKPAEDASSLHQAVAETRGQLRAIDAETDSLTRTNDQRIAEFGSWEDLQEKTGALRYRSTQIKEEMSGLAALPEGFDAPGAFIDHVETLERRRETARTRLSETQQQKAEIEANAPEESAEELAGRLRLAEGRFAAVVARGEGLLRVSQRAHDLQQELDSDTWQPLQQRFQRWLGRTTHGRFSTVHMDALDTREFITTGGDELSPQQLSWGTRDSVALALRMTLAEYAIGDAGGFVIFDDPLVDMDPDRRAVACEAISEFSAVCQTIVLTCHPEHARELGGTLVELP